MDMTNSASAPPPDAKPAPASHSKPPSEAMMTAVGILPPKVRLFLYLIALLLFVGGILLIWNWKIVVGILLIIWATDLQKRVNNH